MILINKAKKFLFCLLLAGLFLPTCRAQSTFNFIGDFKNYQKIDKTIEVQADNGEVRLAYFKNIGFRIRYTFGRLFEPVFSYATIDSVLDKQPLNVREEAGKLIISHDSLQVEIQKNPVRLTFKNSDGLTIFSEDFGAGHQGNKLSHIIQEPDSAVYYGLGEKASKLNRSGRTFTLWNTDAPGYRLNQDPLYTSFPFYIGLNDDKAYGIFYDNSFKSEFDFGAKLKEHVSYSAEGGELRFYVFQGPGINKVLKEYTRLTGRAPLPPKWALGYQQSRWSYYPEQEFYRLADAFRSRKIPLDVLYLDIDYMRGYRVFTWDRNRFPTPKKMISDLRTRGIKTVPIIDPGVKKDSSYFMYNEGVKNDYFVKLPDGSNYIGSVWPGKTAFPDFSKPATRSWWGLKYKTLLNKGAAGIWTDMNEPAVFDGKTMPDIAEFNKEGQHASALEMHNLYGLLMARTTYNGLKKLHPGKRPFVITRAAFSGVQRYSSVWTGDNSAKWDDVKLTMPMIMGLGLSGEPFAGFDIGGFNGSPDGEMYTRFLQIGIFMPFCRTHTVAGSEAQNPWSYGPRYTSINKALIELRYRLLPQLYTAFYQHTQSGSPIIRPLFFEYQDDKATYNIDDQFFLGDHLMVAPVIHQGKNRRDVYLPKGKWYRLFSSEVFKGRRTVDVDAPLKPVAINDKEFKKAIKGVPMFAEAGAVLPTQKVQQYVGEAKIDTMQLNVYAGAGAVSKLYEDAGEGYGYKNGAYRLTTFKTHSSGGKFSISLKRKGNYHGAARTYDFVIHGIEKKPKFISTDGEKITFNFSADNDMVEFNTSADVSTIKLKK